VGIAEEDIARVRAATDFVQVASEHMALRKVGRRWVGLCPFHGEKTPSFSLNAEEGLFYCLAGETGVLTWNGARPIRDLAGTTQRILTERGRWIEAPFRSFGVQPLRRLVLGRNGQKKIIHATPEHRWLLRGSRGSRFERTTDQLKPGDSLSWSFPQNRLRHIGDISPFGIAHGITYGDGCRLNGFASADLHGNKDAQLLKWFPLSRTYQLTTPNGRPYIKVLDLPLHFKERPRIDEAPTYLAGWLAGYFAADGHVAKDGTCLLNSADRSDLEFVRMVCDRLGVGTYGITCQVREGLSRKGPTPLYRVHFISEDLDERFFLLDEHRRRFQSATKAWIRRGWVVRSVEPTGRVEEVYCAVVPKTHNFALEDNILTGNCFGCQAKGDVITFVREIDHLDFAEAVQQLATRAGITLRFDDTSTSQEHQRRERIHGAVEQAVEWYHQRLLTSADGAGARKYLRSRGYDGAVVRTYRLGWAPEGWDTLVRALDVPDRVLRDAGLAFMNKAGRLTDSFRGRVLFPIFDPGGKAVGLGGRVLPGGEGPKYKNTADTAVYNKSRILYGLNWAKKAVVDTGEVVVCEGYTDVIGFALAGVPQAVATCGTALADGHIRLLTNFARRIVLAYDADAAGQGAAERFYEWERKFEVDIAVAAFAPGTDPADLARRNPEALRVAVKEARPYLAFRLERVLSRADLRSPEGRARAAAEAMALVSEHPNELVRDQYLMQVADRCQVDPGRLRSGAWQPARGDRAQQRGSSNAAPEAGSRPAASALPRRAEPSGPELEALRLAVHRPEEVADRLEDVLFADEIHVAAFRSLASASTLHEAIGTADPDVAQLLQRLAVEEAEEDVDDVVARLVDRAGQRALVELQREARAASLPEEFGGVVAWLKLALEQLREPRTRQEAEAGLVPWLVARNRTTA
jgi:DNA primase